MNEMDLILPDSISVKDNEVNLVTIKHKNHYLNTTELKELLEAFILLIAHKENEVSKTFNIKNIFFDLGEGTIRIYYD